jgi:hypothetical protein
MLLVVGISLGSALATSVYGQGRAVKGAGTTGCASWTKERASPHHIQYRAWVDGFLSASNLADNDPDWMLQLANNSEGVYAWVDNYCRTNPLDSIVQAAMKLRDELKSRAR